MNIVSKIQSVVIIFLFSIAFSSFGQSNAKFKVALDAGHGAHDYGAIYNGHIEKISLLQSCLK